MYYFGQAPTDPFDLSHCNPQQKDEAVKIVEGMKKNIDVTRRIHPPVADLTEKELISLLQRYRQSNLCPVLSDQNSPLLRELAQLVDQTKSEATDALATLEQKKQAKIEYKRSGEKMIIIGVVSVITLIMATIGLVVFLKKSSSESDYEEPQTTSEVAPKTAKTRKIEISLE